MKTLTKFTLIVFLLLTMVCGQWTITYAAIPHLINYQGRLTDSSGKPLEGAYNLTFRIYDAETAGNLLWEEIQSGIVIQKGIFSILLGSIKSLDDLPFNKQYYLEIKVNNEVMTPRQIIASAAYAIAGVPSGVIVMWSGSVGSIPKGWALCDGTNGTPDLRDRFIVGARQDEGGISKTRITGSFTQSGGSTTISIDSLPPHTHNSGTLATNTTGAHTHTTPIAFPSGWSEANSFLSAGARPNISTGAAGDHNHSISGLTGTTGSGLPYVQPYYALAFIIKL